MAATTSSWGSKLEAKLAGLAETSSRETVQTLAKWVTFNRKHGADFALVLQKQLQTSSTGRQVVILSLLHEIFVMERSTAKWARFADLRTQLAETTLVPVLGQLGAAAQAKVQQTLLKEWDDINAFGGPTVIIQIRKILNKQQSPQQQQQPPQPLPGSTEDSLAAIDAAALTTRKNSEYGQAEPPIDHNNDAESASAVESLPKQLSSPSGENGGKSDDAAVLDNQEQHEQQQQGALEEQQPEQEQPISEGFLLLSESVDDVGPYSSSSATDVSRGTTTTSTTPAAAAAPAAASSSVPAVTSTSNEAASFTTTTTTKETASSLLPLSYDFEQKGIPAAKVDVKDLLQPCQLIATMQIARELRNDSAVRLSTQLAALPEDIRATCAEAMEQFGTNSNNTNNEEAANPQRAYELTDAKALDYSRRIPEYLLEADLDEELQNLQILSTIIDKQRQARHRLIQLLIQSRCKFGAQEAAESFYQVDQIKAELKQRTQVLADAMELEGLDVVEEEERADNKTKESNVGHSIEEEFPPLTWYNKDEGPSDLAERESKRPRLQE